MSGHFDHFIHNISQDIHSRTKTYTSTNLAIFERESYVFGQKVCFDDYHFILFYSTPPRAKMGQKQYQFRKGTLVCFEPGSDLMVLPAHDREYPPQYLDITVKKEFFQQVASEVSRRNEINFKRIETNFSYRLVEAIANFKNEMLMYGESYPLMMDSIATQIAIQILRDVNGDMTVGRKNMPKDQQSIKDAVDYMQSYYSCSITITDICQTVHLSPNYFIRCFKEQTGQTPYQYLMGIRIRRAQQMLKNAKFSIGEIAMLCGFVNPGHFATLFKRYVGISPTDYRKQMIRLIIPE
jgi:AraC family transcriptional regulator